MEESGGVSADTFILDLVSDPSFLEQLSELTSSEDLGLASTPESTISTLSEEMDPSLIKEYYDLQAETARLRQRQDILTGAIAKLVFNTDSRYKEMPMDKAMEIARSVLTPSVLQVILNQAQH